MPCTDLVAAVVDLDVVSVHIDMLVRVVEHRGWTRVSRVARHVVSDHQDDLTERYEKQDECKSPHWHGKKTPDSFSRHKTLRLRDPQLHYTLRNCFLPQFFLDTMSEHLLKVSIVGVRTVTTVPR